MARGGTPCFDDEIRRRDRREKQYGGCIPQRTRGGVWTAKKYAQASLEQPPEAYRGDCQEIPVQE